MTPRTIVGAVVELIITALVGIILDRYVSTKLAIVALVICLLIIGYLHREGLRPLKTAGITWARENRQLAVCVSGVLGFALFGGAIWFITRRTISPVTSAPKQVQVPAQPKQPNAMPPPKSKPTSEPNKSKDEEPPTLATLFTTDFPTTTKGTNVLSLSSSDGSKVDIKRQLDMDFDAKAEFVSFYIPYLPGDFEKTFDMCIFLASKVKPTIEFFTKKHNVIGGTAGQATDARDLHFTGRVYLYHEMPITNVQRAQIIEKYHSLGYDVEFRGADYLAPILEEWYQKHGFPKPKSR